MSKLSKEAHAFISEFKELCKKHGLDIHASSDYGMVIHDLHEEWLDGAIEEATDDSRFGEGAEE